MIVSLVWLVIWSGMVDQQKCHSSPRLHVVSKIPLKSRFNYNCSLASKHTSSYNTFFPISKIMEFARFLRETRHWLELDLFLNYQGNSHQEQGPSIWILPLPTFLTFRNFVKQQKTFSGNQNHIMFFFKNHCEPYTRAREEAVSNQPLKELLAKKSCVVPPPVAWDKGKLLPTSSLNGPLLWLGWQIYLWHLSQVTWVEKSNVRKILKSRDS